MQAVSLTARHAPSLIVAVLLVGSGPASAQLTPWLSQVWHQDTPGINGAADSSDEFGFVLGVGDFDDDGFEDLVVGVPDDDVSGAEVGAVNVIYGTQFGLSAADDQLFRQGSGLFGNPEDDDNFGWTVAVGDFNDDPYDDLAVAAPREDLELDPTVEDAGVVHVLYGSAFGLTTADDDLFQQGAAGVPGSPGPQNFLGMALTAGNFDGDAYDDLAMAVPGDGNGKVYILPGSSTGVTTTGLQVLDQAVASSGSEGGGDDFGRYLVAGNFDGDAYDDLAAGVPREDVFQLEGTSFEEKNQAGAVHVFYGTSSGLSTTTDQLWSQASPGIQGSADDNDFFGTGLGVGDFDGDGRDDLAVGAPLEDFFQFPSGTIENAGRLHVLYGSSSGITDVGNQASTSGSLGWGTEFGDRFPGCPFNGRCLPGGDFDDDGFDDLAIGVRWEEVTGDAGTNSGMAHVLQGSAEGLTLDGVLTWHRDSPGILGQSELGDEFGIAVAAGDFDGDGDDDLAIGSLEGDAGDVSDAGTVHVLYSNGDTVIFAGGFEEGDTSWWN